MSWLFWKCSRCGAAGQVMKEHKKELKCGKCGRVPDYVGTEFRYPDDTKRIKRFLDSLGKL